MDLSIAVWRKAARSSNNGGDCVEVARVGEVVAVRDGKDPDGPKLLLTPPRRSGASVWPSRTPSSGRLNHPGGARH
ncbi:DUF397 domain-containing protein [Actinomadura luteofluorescens]|uniref:DUF397 domain-containing protein n=1 Tax=Actinomadura luteofluorescens TaxID=46163 RepID=UPI0030D172CD